MSGKGKEKAVLEDEEVVSEEAIEPIVYPHQEAHFEKLEKILQKHRRAVDLSEPGAGKTHIVSALAKKHNMPLFIIAPTNAHPVWEEAIKDYGLDVADSDCGHIITYETLRSIKGKQPKHGFLARHFKENEYNPKKGEVLFETTKNFRRHVRAGTLFVFDEAQTLKNKNDTWLASKTVIRAIGESKNSWVILLSGSLVDKIDQVTNLVLLLGLTKEKYLFTNYFGDLQTKGLDEVYRFIGSYNMEGLRDFIEDGDEYFIPSNATRYVYSLFNKLIQPELTSLMPKLIGTDMHGKSNAHLNIGNGFYEMDERSMIKYNDAIKGIKKLYTLEGGNMNLNEGALGDFQHYLVRIQMAKIDTLIRVVKEDLEKTYNYNGKVCKYKLILYADYYDVIDPLVNELEEYGALRVSGKDNPQERKERLNIFKENNDKCRIIVCNLRVASRSMNLQDMSGEWSRRMYILPCYAVNDTYQASLRTHRMGAKGECYVRFFYGMSYEGTTELKLIHAIAKKGLIMSDVHKNKDTKFPGEFENFFEKDPERLFPGFSRSVLALKEDPHTRTHFRNPLNSESHQGYDSSSVPNTKLSNEVWQPEELLDKFMQYFLEHLQISEGRELDFLLDDILTITGKDHDLDIYETAYDALGVIEDIGFECYLNNNSITIKDAIFFP